MIEKSQEYWFAFTGIILYVAMNDTKRKPVVMWLLRAIVPALLAYALAPDLSKWAGISEPVALVIIVALGPLVLDLAVALIKDTPFLKGLIRSRFGKPSDE